MSHVVYNFKWHKKANCCKYLADIEFKHSRFQSCLTNKDRLIKNKTHLDPAVFLDSKEMYYC